MTRRIPLYLSPKNASQLADLLYRHMVVANTFTEKPSAKANEAAYLLSELRRQCCLRSGMDDPYSELPLIVRSTEQGDRTTPRKEVRQC